MVGNIYLWGNVGSYVISYFHFKGDPRANDSLTISVIPISFAVQACFNPIGAYLQKRYNAKAILGIGGGICILAVYLATLAESWEWFLFFYAGVFPIGIGLIYWTPIICAWEWFGDRKGLATGLIIGGFGFGAFIFGFISTAIVNPDDESRSTDPVSGNDYFSEEVANRVPRMYHECCLYWLCLLIIGIALISRNPEFTKQ